MTTAQIVNQQFTDPERQWLVKLLIQRAQANSVDPALVLAIASRETNIHNIAGDGGHGNGPMQLDNRSHDIPDDWREHPTGIIDLCCALLSSLLQWSRRNHPGEFALACAVAAYNCGRGNASAGAHRGNPDLYTTGHDYSRDVLQRRVEFARLIDAAQLNG